MKKIFPLGFILFFFLFSCTQNPSGGAMLYTVRDNMKTNPEQTLAAISNMGYAYVELAGYENGKFYGMSPLAFKSLLEKYNLQAVSSHHSEITLGNIDQTLADLKILGVKYFVIPVPPMGKFTYDRQTNEMGMKGQYEDLAKILTVLGKKAKSVGLDLLYHNHDFEFVKDQNGETIIDFLLQNTSSEYVNFQMDLFWITKAKADPFAYFEKYPGRFKTWHVKDMNKEGRFTPVGEGFIDFASILKQKSKSGMQYYFIEQDQTYNGRTPLEALAISKANLQSLGFQ